MHREFAAHLTLRSGLGPTREANSIAMAIDGGRVPRPLTDDLMETRLDTEIAVRTATGRRMLDAQPSDSAAIALRAGVPIWVAHEVLEEAGIPAAIVELGACVARAGSASEDQKLEQQELNEQELNDFVKFREDVDPKDFSG